MSHVYIDVDEPEEEKANIDQEDVYEIENPAYVVKKGKGEESGEGCVVAWNKAFERLTKFEPLEIDNAPCYELFEGAQRQKINNKYEYKRICGKDCPYRTGEKIGQSHVLREVWINSKYTNGLCIKYIKRRVDVYIFPFKSEDNNIYALHILIDKGGEHAYEYFEKTISKLMKENEVKEAIRKKIEKLESSFEQEIRKSKNFYT